MTGVLLDGAVSRSERERVEVLLDEADYYATLCSCSSEDSRKLATLRQVTSEMTDSDEGWNEVEDDVIGLINDVLPSGLICVCGEVEPGTVVVRERDEEER